MATAWPIGQAAKDYSGGRLERVELGTGVSSAL